MACILHTKNKTEYSRYELCTARSLGRFLNSSINANDFGMNSAPVEVPCADSVACSGIQHRSGGIEGDLVDLVLALGCSDGASGCTSTGIA